MTITARRARRADLKDYLAKRPPPPGEPLRYTARGFRDWVRLHAALDGIDPYPMPFHRLLAELRALTGSGHGSPPRTRERRA